jgi:hypothetical protein
MQYIMCYSCLHGAVYVYICTHISDIVRTEHTLFGIEAMLPIPHFGQDITLDAKSFETLSLVRDVNYTTQ